MKKRIVIIFTLISFIAITPIKKIKANIITEYPYLTVEATGFTMLSYEFLKNRQNTKAFFSAISHGEFKKALKICRYNKKLSLSILLICGGLTAKAISKAKEKFDEYIDKKIAIESQYLQTQIISVEQASFDQAILIFNRLSDGGQVLFEGNQYKVSKENTLEYFCDIDGQDLNIDMSFSWVEGIFTILNVNNQESKAAGLVYFLRNCARCIYVPGAEHLHQKQGREE